MESWFLFWDKVASRFFNSIPAYDLYNATSKGGWKAMRYALPTSVIEAGVAGFRQYYRDQSLSPIERTERAFLVGFETYVTDRAAGIAGDVFGLAGYGVGGPVGAGLGYIGGNVLTTRIGDHLWADFNQDVASKALGAFP